MGELKSEAITGRQAGRAGVVTRDLGYGIWSGVCPEVVSDPQMWKQQVGGQWASAPLVTLQLSLENCWTAPTKFCTSLWCMTPGTRLCWFCGKKIRFEVRWPTSRSCLGRVALKESLDLLGPQALFYTRGITISHRMAALCHTVAFWFYLPLVSCTWLLGNLFNKL